jgi:hypothetical protein
MTTHDATIDIDENPVRFQLDFATFRWSAEREIDESSFPLVAEVDDKRYELYSDGTFAEEELK